MKKNYVANLIGEGVFDDDLPVDRPDPRPVRVGDEGVLLLYGDRRDGGTVVVAAYDEDDAERRLLATFSDAVTIDDLQESTDQRPLSVAYTAGLVPDSADSLLRFEARARPLLEAATRDEVLAASQTLAALEDLMDEVTFAILDDSERRYLVARFDVTDLSPDEIDSLAGEVSAQAEASDDGHPSVEMTSSVVVERSERPS